MKKNWLILGFSFLLIFLTVNVFAYPMGMYDSNYPSTSSSYQYSPESMMPSYDSRGYFNVYKPFYYFDERRYFPLYVIHYDRPYRPHYYQLGLYGDGLEVNFISKPKYW